MNPNSPLGSLLNPFGEGYFIQKQTEPHVCRKGKQTRGETGCMESKWITTARIHQGRKDSTGHVGPQAGISLAVLSGEQAAAGGTSPR